MDKEVASAAIAERAAVRGNAANARRTGITAAWERLVAIEARDEEEARLGRLFNTLLMIGNLAIVVLCTAFVLMPLLGLASRPAGWTATAISLFFIPLSIFCLVGAKRGYVPEMIHLYLWIHFLGVATAVWLFGSPAWVVFAWTITVAGILLAPSAALWVAGGVLAYFVLLQFLSHSGLHTPTFEFGDAGREFASAATLMSMLVSAVGLVTYLNMTSLRRALGNLRDEIADRKKAEQNLRQSEERYRSIFEYVDDIIYTIEPDGMLSSLSPSCERKLGWRPEEWIGRPFLLALHPDDQPYAYELATKAFTTAQAGQALPMMPLRVLMKMGGYLDMEVAPVIIHHDDRIAILGVARDISERKRVEEKIRRLNEELEAKVQERTKQLREAQAELVRKERLSVLGQVAGSVGHELRNPLGVMSNAVYFLQTMLTGADDTTKEYLNIIKDEIGNSERIVSDLLDAVRTKPPQAGTVNLAKLIDQVLQTYAVPASVTVKRDIPDTLPLLAVDSLQMQQVFRNIISNAVEAMPQGGTLEISGVENKADQTVTVAVRDTGTGMPPEVMEKLFQPLFTTKARGIGLGLVVVKNLTQANGGTVNVESEVGKGTVFHVTLPCAG